MFQGSGVYAVNGTVPDYISHLFNNGTEELQGKSCQLPVIVPQEGSSGHQMLSESCEAFVERFVRSNRTFTRCGNGVHRLITVQILLHKTSFDPKVL